MSVFLSLAFFGMLKAQDEGRTWLKRYNIDPMDSNPVFTRPMHENSSARKDGAGICMDDGLAYNCRSYIFGEGWHYEPKLAMCQEEENTFSSVTGEYLYSDGKMRITTAGQVLKNGVIPTDFGAIVAYRVWGRSSNDPVRHYFATYDKTGRLIDAFYAGHRAWMNEILKAEPHGNYTPKENMGGGGLDFSADNKLITKTDYYYYQAADGKSGRWEDTTVMNISDEGLFSVVSRSSTGKPEVNMLADELYILETLPLSHKDALRKWNTFIRKNKTFGQLQERVDADILRLFVSRQQEYMAWTEANRQESVLIGALKPSLEKLARDYGGGTVQMLIEKALEDCTNPTVKNYWMNLKLIRSIMSGEI